MDNQGTSAVQPVNGTQEQQIDCADNDNGLSAILNSVGLENLSDGLPATRRIELAKCQTCSRFVLHPESDCPKNPKFDYEAEDFDEDECIAAEDRRLEAVRAYQDQLIVDPMVMKAYYGQGLSNEHPGFRIPPGGSSAATHAVLSTTELLEEILLYLRTPDLLRCMTVCQRFDRVIRGAPALGKLLWWDQTISQGRAEGINYHLLEPGTFDEGKVEFTRPKLSRSIKGFPRLRYHVPQLAHEWNEQYGLTHELELLVRPEFLNAEKAKSFCWMYLSDCTEPLRVKITQDASPALFRGPRSFWWESITVWMRPASFGVILNIALALYVEVCSLKDVELTYDDPEWLRPDGSMEIVSSTLPENERNLLIADKPIVATGRSGWALPGGFGHDFVKAESEIDWETDAQEIARCATEAAEYEPMLAQLAVPRHLCDFCLRYVVHPEESCYYNEEAGRSSNALIRLRLIDEVGDGEAKDNNPSEEEQHIEANSRTAFNDGANDGEAESDEAGSEEAGSEESETSWISDRNLNWALEQVQLLGDKFMDDPLQLAEYMSHALPASHPAYKVESSSQRSATRTVFAGQDVRILEHILSNLNTFDLLRCEQVSKRFGYTMSTTPYLKHRLWRMSPAELVQEGGPFDPVLNYSILSYENACQSTKRCTLNVRGAHLWPEIKYFVPEPIAPHRIWRYGERPRLEIHLTAEMTPETLRGPGFLAMYLNDITADTWVSVSHKEELPEGSLLPFERIDVKLRPATLGTMFAIASKLYQEALQLHGPAVQEDWRRDKNAKPFVPSTLTAREEKLVVGRIGLFERFNARSRWFRGVGQVFAENELDGYQTEHAEEEDGDAYDLSEEAVEEIIHNDW